jgi:ubiquinone/menaquinone biosynthesis C-methylase UbiE
MSTQRIGEDKAADRSAWAMGDYDRFATQLIWSLGADLVDACGVTSGQRVLDVATGTGNTALRAAKAGANVVASDLSPEHFPAGQGHARVMGVEIEWVEADAEALPFPDADFDVVMSSVGAMWAPDHQRVADELIRVCRPGGTIGLLTFAADGLLPEFLSVFEPYLPPPPAGASSPVLWGDEAHVRTLFGDRVDSLSITQDEYVEQVDGGPLGYCEFYKQAFGPVVATYVALADDEQRRAELDRDFLDFAGRVNQGPPGGPAQVPFSYLRIIARMPGRT